MRITEQDVNYILNLSRGEKPEKRIREYLNSFEGSEKQKEKRIEFFNRCYESFFNSYFQRFTWHHKKECVLEAYIVALEKLKNDAPLEVALEEGLKKGSKYFEAQNEYESRRTVNEID